MAYPIRLIAAACLFAAGCSEPEAAATEAPVETQTAATTAASTAPAFGPVASELAAADPARASIQSAIEAAVTRSLGLPAKVDVEIMRGQGDWAFVSGPAVSAEGGEIDLSKTTMAQAADEGMMDGTTVVALLRRVGGVWSVATMAIGPTDVPQVGWPDQYGVSPALVGQEEAEGGA
ncbi:MAG: hypothetical protein JWR59_2335 [Brevundimonas sp.]|nr:hypothetical protein [Brevundimonas sp.]